MRDYVICVNISPPIELIVLICDEYIFWETEFKIRGNYFWMNSILSLSFHNFFFIVQCIFTYFILRRYVLYSSSMATCIKLLADGHVCHILQPVWCALNLTPNAALIHLSLLGSHYGYG